MKNLKKLFLMLALMVSACGPTPYRTFVAECPGAEKREIIGQRVWVYENLVKISAQGETIAILPVNCTVYAKK